MSIGSCCITEEDISPVLKEATITYSVVPYCLHIVFAYWEC